MSLYYHISLFLLLFLSISIKTNSISQNFRLSAFFCKIDGYNYYSSSSSSSSLIDWLIGPQLWCDTNSLFHISLSNIGLLLSIYHSSFYQLDTELWISLQLISPWRRPLRESRLLLLLPRWPPYSSSPVLYCSCFY